MAESTSTTRTLTVGVLALQGAFEEHIDMLEGLRATSASGQSVVVTAVAIRLPEQLQGVDALVLPGGESTTIGKVAVRWGSSSRSSSGWRRVAPSGARARA